MLPPARDAGARLCRQHLAPRGGVPAALAARRGHRRGRLRREGPLHGGAQRGARHHRRLPPQRDAARHPPRGGELRRRHRRHGHAAPAAPQRRHHPGGRNRGCAALCLAGLHARRGAPLLHQGGGHGAARPPGAVQVQQVPLAPDRRPGVAHRNQALPRADGARRLA